MDSDAIESVVSTIEKEQAKKTFWEKNEKGTIKIVHFYFKQFLEDNGYYKFCPEGSKNYVFVKVSNNLIDHTTEKEITDFVLIPYYNLMTYLFIITLLTTQDFLKMSFLLY